MAVANTEVKNEVQVDDFDAAFEASVTAGEAAVHAKTDDTTTVDDKKDDVVITPPDNETAEAKATREAAEKVASDAAAAEVLKNETPEQKAARETAEAETARQATADAQAQVIADAAAASLAEINERKAREEAARVEAARVAAAQETPEQKAAREAHEAAIKPYEMTAEEKEQDEKFKKEFPGEYAAMIARLKAITQDANARVSVAEQRMLQHINGVVTPVAQTSEALALQAHRTAIMTAHSDFDAVITKVPDWIKTQPKYLQPALQKVYDAGDTQSVIDLVADYKKATGTTTVAKTAAEIAAEATAQAAADETKRKAAEDAAALLPVKGKRTVTSPKGQADPNDFDSAFAEAAAA